MTVSSRMIKTSHGDIAVSQTSGDGLPVLLLHGNSSCKEVFRYQLGSDLGDRYRMIAVDLPGHGASSDAIDPAKTYTMPGYADVSIEVLRELGVDRTTVFGWSLGGHVALELLAAFPGVVGLMLTGTPPVARDMESIQKGFQPTPAIFLAGKEEFTADDFVAFGELTVGKISDPVLNRALHRADGRARRIMFESLVAGKASDQRQIAEKSTVPVAIVNGANEPIVNLEYVASLNYDNLWEEHCFALRGLAHVPFFEAPDTFNPIFARFIRDIEKQSSHDVTKMDSGGVRRAG